jgi:hypothetical protein
VGQYPCDGDCCPWFIETIGERDQSTPASIDVDPISAFSKTKAMLTLGPSAVGPPVFCHATSTGKYFYAESSTGAYVETRYCASCGTGDFGCAVNTMGELAVVWDQDGWKALGPVPPIPFEVNTSFVRIIGALFDSRDRLHVAFQAARGLEWATFDGGAWSTAVVGDAMLDIYAAMTLGPDDDRHIVYLSSEGLTHAHFAGSAWTFSAIVGIGEGGQPDVAVGSDGVVHVVLYDNAARVLRYAARGLAP